VSQMNLLQLTAKAKILKSDIYESLSVLPSKHETRRVIRNITSGAVSDLEFAHQSEVGDKFLKHLESASERWYFLEQQIIHQQRIGRLEASTAQRFLSQILDIEQSLNAILRGLHV
jgi:hypothetical protein